jgi:16S rRNA (guanine527-N7)-methyltransferase
MNLQEGVASLGCGLPENVLGQLAAFLALLAKWNRSYNLTAIRQPEEMVTHHVLDSLAVLPLVEKSALPGRQQHPFSLADVGSGAGLPGLVLAIARPDWQITSIEAVDKKAAFQRQVKIELGLDNVSICGSRVEQVAECFDAVISRAFASLADYVRLAGSLSDVMWAMKGQHPAAEISQLPTNWRMTACHELQVPGLMAARHLLKLEKI